MLSIGMTCYNAIDYSRDALNSLAVCTTVPYELFVCDNGSDTSNVAKLKSLCAEYRSPYLKEINFLTFHPRPEWTMEKKVGGLRNLLMEEIYREQFCVTCDNDIFFTPGWAEHVLAIMRTFPEVGLLGLRRETGLAHRIVHKTVQRYGIAIAHIGTVCGCGTMLDRQRWIEVGKPAWPEEPLDYGPEHGSYKGNDAGYSIIWEATGYWLAVPLENRIEHRWQPRNYR